MKILRNNSGFTIIFVLILMIVVMVIGSSILFVSSSTMDTQNKWRSERQAYFNVKSAAQIFTKEFLKTEVPALYNETGEILSVSDGENGSDLNGLLKKIILFRMQDEASEIEFTAKVEELNLTATFMFKNPNSYDITASFESIESESKFKMYAKYIHMVDYNNVLKKGMHSYLFNGYSSEP